MTEFTSDTSSKIKAIETKFDGHLFRSRLEARWAVVFKELGLIYEYESEGYDLGALGWYLPDFYLPSLKLWIETKPYTTPLKNIYMAGKISQNGWRNALADIRHESFFDTDHYVPIKEHFLNYVGPFFISCDHGCSHGRNEHGVGCGCGDNSEYSIQSGPDYDLFVMNTCLKNINRCQTVYAWIDSLDCYGTLLELGYAYANRKDIRIAIDEKLKLPIDTYIEDNPHLQRESVGSHDLWFLEKMANEFIFSSSAKDGFDTLYNKDIPIEVQKLKSVSILKNQRYVVIYGNPSHYVECGDTSFIQELPQGSIQKYRDAIDFAGSYRF